MDHLLSAAIVGIQDTRGRVGVFEMLPTSPELEQTILTKPIEEDLYKVARAQGMFTMKEDAIMKMLEGTVPFEEVNTLGGDLSFDEESGTPQGKAPNA